MDSPQSQSPLRFVTEKLFKLIEAVAWVCFVAMMVVMLIQVFTRYVFNHPLPWTEELSRFSYIWAIFLGSILAQRSKSHMTVTILIEKIPPTPRLILEILTDIFSALVMAIVLYGTFIQMRKTYGILASSIPISYTFVYLALAIGAGGMILLLIADFFRSIAKLISPPSSGK